MKIKKSKVIKLHITPDDSYIEQVSVYLEDFGVGQGKIIITCDGEVWIHYWGAMGDRTIAEFFSQTGTDYLVNKLSSEPQTVTDYAGIPDMLRKEICERRRNDEFDKSFARNLWWEVEGTEFDERLEESQLISDIMGDDWWHCLPTKPNHKYEYLYDIVEVVKLALKS